MNKAKKNPHYVNNKDFYDALLNYKIKVDAAKEKGLPRPQITNYLGDCFLKIATHLSYRPNFVNYMFREDMISDGVENCVQYINNFDVEKTNPFAYFTQIVYYAFLRRIQKEKRQMEIKEKILEKSGFDQVFSVDGEVHFSSDYNTIKENIQMKLYQ
jgi:DNA-directed RNA polymerase specialized sigma24 family protein